METQGGEITKFDSAVQLRIPRRSPRAPPVSDRALLRLRIMGCGEPHSSGLPAAEVVKGG